MFYVTLNNLNEILTSEESDVLSCIKYGIAYIESSLFPEVSMFHYVDGDVEAYLSLHEEYENADLLTKAKMYYVIDKGLTDKSIDEYVNEINLYQGELEKLAQEELAESLGIAFDDSRIFYFDLNRYVSDVYSVSSRYEEFTHNGYWTVCNKGDF